MKFTDFASMKHSERVNEAERIIAAYRQNQVDFVVNSATGNLLVTGRPNSGWEDFRNNLVGHFEAQGIGYTTHIITDEMSALFAFESMENNPKIAVVSDPKQLLFSNGRIPSSTNLIYFTHHWSRKDNMEGYNVFNHHIAFASFRNQDLMDYPVPFAAIGSDMQSGEYISVDTGSFSAISRTNLV